MLIVWYKWYFPGIQIATVTTCEDPPLLSPCTLPHFGCRHDVVLTPPSTWQQLLQLAAQLNGTTLNGSSSPAFGICLEVRKGKHGAVAGVLFNGADSQYISFSLSLPLL